MMAPTAAWPAPYFLESPTMSNAKMLFRAASRCAFGWLTAAVTWCAIASIASAAAGPLVLKNDALSVSLEPATGQIVALTNSVTGETQIISSEEFLLETSHGPVAASKLRVAGVESSNTAARFRLAGEGLDVELVYQIGPAWLEKWIEVHFTKTTDLLRVDLGTRHYQPAFVEAGASRAIFARCGRRSIRWNCPSMPPCEASEAGGSPAWPARSSRCK